VQKLAETYNLISTVVNTNHCKLLDKTSE